MKPRKLPRYVHGYMDRHGAPRFYFRKAGLKSVALPGLPWSPQFMEVYERALKRGEGIELGSKRTVHGTISAALISYYQSTAFSEVLAKVTQQNRRAILEAFRADHGDKRVSLMHATALQNIINKKRPAAQRNFKKAMRGFIDYCITHNLIKVDALEGTKLSKMKTKGHHTWTEEEIAQYRARHAPGTKARLAVELLLQTGHARADVVRMGRQHVRNGKLSMRRQKTDVQFDIPLLPDLVAEIELHPKTGLAYLLTEQGKPFTAAGFGNKFREWCDQAGLGHCAAHGLRKASAVRHALNGASAFELMAWHGWKTIGEAQRYVDEANRILLAESAGAKMRTTSG
ncbi:tyrosine-type recombinase/integrase [Bradyrhizobium tunisiense]|uniref:tyrosine-type recombinase/integrase n=1 Tax=Bradyrhizobium tunisiense TaxID=3278709 RepID=UPI0035DC630E